MEAADEGLLSKPGRAEMIPDARVTIKKEC